jgi:hypothetical protein
VASLVIVWYCSDCHRDPCRTLIFSFSWWRKAEDEKKHRTFMLGFKMEATGSYENIEEVTKENIYECTGNEFKCFRKERKCHYD